MENASEGLMRLDVSNPVSESNLKYVYVRVVLD